jgi:hypothetical protein
MNSYLTPLPHQEKIDTVGKQAREGIGKKQSTARRATVRGYCRLWRQPPRASPLPLSRLPQVFTPKHEQPTS